jgi:hypothetical protein
MAGHRVGYVTGSFFHVKDLFSPFRARQDAGSPRATGSGESANTASRTRPR